MIQNVLKAIVSSVMILLFGFISLIFMVINYQLHPFVTIGYSPIRTIGYSIGIIGIENEALATYLTEKFPSIALAILIIAILATSLFSVILMRSIKAIKHTNPS